MDPYIKQLNELIHRIEILSEELDIANDLIDSLIGEEINEENLVEAKKWIQKAIKKEGALRKTMKTKEGKTIPVSKLKKAAEKGGKTGKRARLALTLRKLNESGVVNAFNDSDDKPGEKEKIATQPDWAEGIVVHGTRMPSKEFAGVYRNYIKASDTLGAAARSFRTQKGPNIEFAGTPEHTELFGALRAAEQQMKTHPHYSEYSKGHPSTRMSELTPEEKATHELEMQYGTSYTLDPVTKKPVYGKRNPRGLGT